MTEDGAIEAGPSRDVFVSYASQDAAVATSIVEHLERQAHQVLDGATGRPSLAPCMRTPSSRAINEAKASVLVLSASAMASSHVGREVERAASKHKPIIAFRIDAAPLSPVVRVLPIELAVDRCAGAGDAGGLGQTCRGSGTSPGEPNGRGRGGRAGEGSGGYCRRGGGRPE